MAKKTFDTNNDWTKHEILIVGMGGEGVVFAGDILGVAATLDGKFATQRNAYGASQRGEAVCSEVIISNKPVQYPFIEMPTHLISLSQQAFNAYVHRVKNNRDLILFMDSTLKQSTQDLGRNNKSTIKKFKARRAAMENDIPQMANIIILSSFIKYTKIVSYDALKQALSKKGSEQVKNENLKALNLGWKLKQNQ